MWIKETEKYILIIIVLLLVTSSWSTNCLSFPLDSVICMDVRSCLSLYRLTSLLPHLFLCKVRTAGYYSLFFWITILWIRLWPSMFFSWLTDSVCVCLWRHRECNHEAAASDPAARSLSGFSSFTSQQDIFGVAVSDTLIITGRPGCQWSATISILHLLLLLLFSVMQGELSLHKRVTDGCLASKCWWRSRQLRICQVAHLWADRGAERVLLLWAGPGPVHRWFDAVVTLWVE